MNKNQKDPSYYLGYPTDEGCEICGKKPAYAEPRFYYVFCEDHKDVPPAYWHEWVAKGGNPNE